MPVRDVDALRTLIDGGDNVRLRSVCTLLGLSIQGNVSQKKNRLKTFLGAPVRARPGWLDLAFCAVDAGAMGVDELDPEKLESAERGDANPPLLRTGDADLLLDLHEHMPARGLERAPAASILPDLQRVEGGGDDDRRSGG